MNIAIIAAGAGQRFVDEGYTKPKPLIVFRGKAVIFWLLDSLRISSNDSVAIVYTVKMDKYRFKDAVMRRYPRMQVSFKSLMGLTRGPAETALIASNLFTDSAKPLLVLDCDSFYISDIVSVARSASTSTIFYFTDTQSKPIFSYISINDDLQVTSIAEKNKISDNANVGAYHFATTDLFREYALKALSTDSRSEVYVSHLYAKMIEDSVNVVASKVSKHVCLGTPSQLKYQSRTHHADCVETPLVFCFDLDNTLVSHPVLAGDYSTVTPIHENISFANMLYGLGHTVIIYTARRMKTHHGNVEAVISDIGSITEAKLHEFGVKYHRIVYGKPYADFYIDDLGVNAFDDLQRETGFYDLYDGERKQNEVRFLLTNMVKKRTANIGECYWYKNVPKPVADLFPRASVDMATKTITMKKIEGIPYSYLFVGDLMTTNDLDTIIKDLNRLHTCVVDEGERVQIDIYANYARKLESRYKSSDYSAYPNSEALYAKISSRLREYEALRKGKCTVIHGDPVFTNIFKTLNGENVFIDMRGVVGNQQTIRGDTFYDYAKLYQSLCGYDFILKNRDMSISSNQLILRTHFETEFERIFGLEMFVWLKVLTASLLFSLVPLHHSDMSLKRKYLELAEILV